MTSPNIISPCSRLNDDVLREIFIHCASIFENCSKCFVIGGRKRDSIRELPQLSVSHVCSSWRHVALLTPQLWNNVMIKCFSEPNLTIVREYLSRAGNLPICFMLDNFIVERGLGSQLTDFLSSCRLQSLIIRAKIPCFDLVLGDLPQRSVADLESLSLDNDFFEEAFIDLNDIRYPKLASVIISGACKISGFSSSLRTFDGSITVIASWALLSLCPYLEEARLRIIPDNDNQRQLRKPRVCHGCLRRLILEPRFGGDKIPFSIFIAALALPSLELLCASRVLVEWSVAEFQSLAQRSNHFPNLSNFTLSQSNSDVDLGTLLASMPSVTRVYLRCAYSTYAVLDRLASDSLASGSLAPRLQYLSVEPISNPGEFMDMVESRMRNAQMSSNGVPAQFTRIVLPCGRHSDVVRLDDMQWRGIPICRVQTEYL